MNTKKIICMATAFALTSWLASAADGTGMSPQSPSQDQGNSADMSGKAPQEYNKATSLIGMEVQNLQGEHIGHIKDIVLDLNSEKVSYAVLTTAPKALPIDEKLLAVPLNAFTVSADQKHLILNTDKSKVETAAGFTSKNWPNVGNPTWGAQPFWQENNMSPASPNNPINNAPGNGGPGTK